MTWLFALLSSAHAIQWGLTADASQVRSRWDYASPTSTFSLLAQGASETRVNVSAGGQVFEAVGGVELGSFKYVPPETRALSLDQVKTTAIFGGVRAKAKFAWLTLTYRRVDTLYLIEDTPTIFQLRSAPTGLAVATLTLFGFGQFYRLAMDADVGMPIAAADTPIGSLRYTQFARGIGRIEFGGRVRIGFHAGLESHGYRIDTSTYNRTDSILGVTLAIGGDKKSWLAKPSSSASSEYLGLYPGT